MLKEIKATRQISGEPARRWFCDDDMDLMIWHDADGYIGFQLCYDKSAEEKALSWKQSTGLVHDIVDSGENRDGHYKATPILHKSTEYDLLKIRADFIVHSELIDNDIKHFVIKYLE